MILKDMTTEEFFKNLASELELTQSETERVAEKHTWLREKLREKLPVEDDFLTGSYARHTIIRPEGDAKFDVDFFLVFDKEEYGESSLEELLQTVRGALDIIKIEDLAIEEIRMQSRSVAVVYKDGFQIDVVPAIQIEKDKLYKIFDKKTLAAIDSNPKLHGEILTAANEATASNSTKRLVPMIKILKHWKRKECDYMKSFHLELLMIETLSSLTISSYSSAIAYFFANVDMQKPLIDPSNAENVIDAYLDDDNVRDDLSSLIDAESKIAEKALELEDNDDTEGAIAQWKEIFETENNAEDKTIFVNRTPSKPWCDFRCSAE